MKLAFPALPAACKPWAFLHPALGLPPYPSISSLPPSLYLLLSPPPLLLSPVSALPSPPHTQDYSWFVTWNGTSAVDSIPSEVSVSRLLHSIGAPVWQSSSLILSDKPLLMEASLPESARKGQVRVAGLLQWAVEEGAILEMKEMKQVPLPPSPHDHNRRQQQLPPHGNHAMNGGGHSGSFMPSKLIKGKLLRNSLARRMESDRVAPETPVDESKSREMSVEEVMEATHGWSEEMRVGEGGSGVVYRGEGGNEKTWAVKRAKKGDQLKEEFETEVRDGGQASV